MEKHDAHLDKVSLKKLNERQQKMLSSAVEAMREAQAEAQDAEARVRTLIAFVMPEYDGSVEFNIDDMTFYAEGDDGVDPDADR